MAEARAGGASGPFGTPTAGDRGTDDPPWSGWSDMGVFDAIFTPRATRIYQKRVIADDVLSKILRAGTFACSSGNTQPWELVVVTDDQIKDQLQRNLAAAFATVDVERTQSAEQLVDGATHHRPRSSGQRHQRRGHRDGVLESRSGRAVPRRVRGES